MKYKKFSKAVISLVSLLSVLCLSVSASAADMCTVADAATAPAMAATDENVKVSSRFFELIFGKSGKEEDADTKVPAGKPLLLCPGGQIFGVKIRQDGVVVREIREGSAAAGTLAVGDLIRRVNGREVHDTAELGEVMRTAGTSVRLSVLRDGYEKTFTLPTSDDGDGKVLGIAVRDSTAGIGTVTFIDPETGVFGGLGHGICDADSGQILPMREGIVTDVILGGVQRGESGKPGELRGVLKNRVTGKLLSNNECGVFGRLTEIPEGLSAVEVAAKADVHEGPATILSTVHGGGIGKYEVKISDIDTRSTGKKSFTVEVTDPTLIAVTGGIVRGMSGSPILQDGKLVGAVTHVMVSDPKTGYGIFIENMLASVPEEVAPAA